MSNKAIFEDIGIRDYGETWDYQEEHFNALISTKIGKEKSRISNPKKPQNRVIFVEHPHVYTLGKSGSEDNLLLSNLQLRAKDATFIITNRGGDITYHGPGQIVGYPIFDLELFSLRLKEYIHKLEDATILTLKNYGIVGDRMDGATGVWLDKNIADRARKICAIGVRASRYITMHGFAFNVNTQLEYFSNINPCGFTDKGVTSLEKELGVKQDFEAVKAVMKEKIKEVFEIDWIEEY